MARSLLTPRADQGIVDLFERGLDYSDQAAVRVADIVASAVRRLELFPESGSPRPSLGEAVRVVPLRRLHAVLYYEVVGEELVVLRVLREERDVAGEDLS